MDAAKEGGACRVRQRGRWLDDDRWANRADIPLFYMLLWSGGDGGGDGMLLETSLVHSGTRIWLGLMQCREVWQKISKSTPALSNISLGPSHGVTWTHIRPIPSLWCSFVLQDRGGDTASSELWSLSNQVGLARNPLPHLPLTHSSTRKSHNQLSLKTGRYTTTQGTPLQKT